MTAPPRRRWFYFAFVSVVLGTGFLAIVVLHEAPPPFDAASWRDQQMIDKGVRLKMGDGLIARNSLRGLSRAEVLETLGEPTTEGYFRDWDLVYWLGPERGLFSIDSEWLVIRLGVDGHVNDCRLIRD